MPPDALPPRARKGRLSYTVDAPGLGGAKIEVLLKQRAFRIIKTGIVNGFFDLIWGWMGSGSLGMEIGPMGQCLTLAPFHQLSTI